MSRVKTHSIILSFLLAACGGDGGTGPDEMEPMGNGNGTGSSRVIKANPSFAADIQEIFTRKGCASASCHGSSAQAGLNLSAGSAYGNLVGVQSSQVDLLRVAPGDPANSYLVRKVEGTASFGAQMPLGGTALDAIDRNNIRNWIAAGAQNN